MADTHAQAQINPLDLPETNDSKKSTSSSLLQNIVKTETSGGVDNILRDAPEFDQTLLRSVSTPKNFLLIMLKSLFILLVIASLASFLFFSSQLTSMFDFLGTRLNIPNISTELAASNSEITALKTDVNFYRYLKAKANLDEFSYYGDSFVKNYEIQNSQTATNSERSSAESQMAKDRVAIKEAFIAASTELLSKPFTVTVVSDATSTSEGLRALFEGKLREKLMQKAAEINKVQSKEAQTAALNYAHTANLIGNTKLTNLMAKTDIDALSDAELYDFIKETNSLVVNNLSIVQSIKDKRIKWSDIMNEIENRTIDVDQHYSQDSYDQFGGIRYTSYDFEAGGPSIAISGETKRFDTINFTVIVNLIQKLNESPFFANGEMRSFTKSGSQQEGYTANLKISLDLEQFNAKIQQAKALN